MSKTINLNTDENILSQIIEGDNKGMELLFKKYYTFLVRFSLQMVTKEDAAEDIVQEVFIKLWDKRDTLEGVNNIKAYLFQATKNSSLNWIKSKKNQNESIDSVNFTHSSSNNIEEQLEFEEAQNKINRALALLPEKCKEVFLLSRNEEKSYKEIAELLNISIKTVENHMGKALKVLRSELGIILFTLYLLEKLS